MKYRKGRLRQKGQWGWGKWLERYKAKRTCRDSDFSVPVENVGLDIEPMTPPKDIVMMTSDVERQLEGIVKAMGVPARLIVIDSYSEPVKEAAC